MEKTVLIIEDDADTRSIYEKALTNAGYKVLTATNGAEGVHIARKHRPSIILLDIRMPVMDGWQAVRYLKTYQETQRIPICGISAYEVTEEERRRLGSMDFDCFLTKPADPRNVVTQVEAQIGASERPMA